MHSLGFQSIANKKPVRLRTGFVHQETLFLIKIKSKKHTRIRFQHTKAKNRCC